TAVPTETAVPPTETPTATPIPTFTPPALPLTSPNEHYWLRRPIPDGGTVWTDKVYSYGSTRGGTLRTHHGVEFYVPSGTEILAAASGTVVVAGDDLTVPYGPHTNFYGNLIVIELDSRWNNQPVYTLYGHLSEVLVSEGQHVNAQELIGLSGASGVADGAHLHFEVRLGQNSYESTRNPLLWLYPFPDFGTVAGRVTWPDGSLAREVPITLRRIDGPSRYLAGTTYADDTVNPDDLWQENFAIDDVPAGYYELVIDMGEKKIKQELWVFPYQTAFVEIVLQP
ncbi:MAG: M23 family metallopeptidase, partial [Chloroflexi bacterium]